ncbi:hypothetical protein OS493_018346 [Desmophyllum pertusum]|uniref:Uncharacterized protein n=1 Tax=Desmophyllum pertusum TaxID=174260 RepID=A0A9W9YC14_9CNID|nr:hypothetical protein OS493_018346 [Desmophyllum pertusum]
MGDLGTRLPFSLPFERKAALRVDRNKILLYKQIVAVCTKLQTFPDYLQSLSLSNTPSFANVLKDKHPTDHKRKGRTTSSLDVSFTDSLSKLCMNTLTYISWCFMFTPQ